MATEKHLHSLRQKLRIQRNDLSIEQQNQHAQKIAQNFLQSQYFATNQSIAAYLSTQGEADLETIIRAIQQHSTKICYLPVILSIQNAQMLFAPYHSQTELKANSFGILEPIYKHNELKKAADLDLILAPLVGFDDKGHRIGMGGGYYDRALQHLRNSSTNTQIKPHYVGMAHALQEVSHLEQYPWDIPLNAIITEHELRHF